MFPLEVSWTTDLGLAPTAPPSFDDIHAYIPLRNGTLTAVRLIDGSPVWTVERPTPFSPAAGWETVIVATDETLTAVWKENGLVRWSIKTGTTVSAGPIWVNGWLIVLLVNGDIVTFRGVDGKELWRLSLGGSLIVPPAVGGADLFVPVADGRIVAIDLESGRQLWELKLGGSPQEILALDALFVGTTDNYFYRLSRKDGHVEWRWRTGGDIVGRASVDLERVFFLSLDNALRALDRDSGVQKWRSVLGRRPRSGPVLIEGDVLVSGVSPELRAFDSASGKASNILVSPGELAAPPHFTSTALDTGPRLVLTISDGRLIGMSPATNPHKFSLLFPPRPLRAEPPLLELEDIFPSFESMVLADEQVDLSDHEFETVVFSVQVAAVNSRSGATELARRLVVLGFPAYVIPASDNVDQLYRVRIGESLDQAEAQALTTLLSQEQKIDAYIVKAP